MRKLSLVASMLGCISLAMFSPGVASAAAILTFDDITENPSTTFTGFKTGGFSLDIDPTSGNEVISFVGGYSAPVATIRVSGEAFVVLLDPGTGAVSDILDINFVQSLGSTTVAITGTFTSDGDLGIPLVAPQGLPQNAFITETGDFQDVSSILQSQGFRSDIQVLLASDVENSNGAVPEPASLIVWSFIASCVGVSGLRRRWRAAKAV